MESKSEVKPPTPALEPRVPGYFAIIPAPIRYDDSIPANAKLLYGEISALIGPEGFCHASNGYFAKLYKLSERTVSGLISTLADNHYIVVVVDRDRTGKVERRKLFLTMSATEGHPVEENFYTPRKYFREGIENIFQYTNTSNTDIEIDKRQTVVTGVDSKPQADSHVLKVFSEWLAEIGSGWYPEQREAVEQAFIGLVEMRKKLKKPLTTARAVRLCCNNLSQLSKGDPREMARLLDYAVERNWLTVYPITGGSKPAAPKPTKGRVYECL